MSDFAPKTEHHLQVFTTAHEHIGHFAGALFYTTVPVNLRVDGNEVYSTDIPCKLVGYLTNNQIELINGMVLYHIKN